MITQAHIQTMAAYNQWMNRNVYGAADQLSDAQRQADQGAFWGSVQGTLAHIMWADQIWLQRFGVIEAGPATPLRQSAQGFEDWPALKAARTVLDDVLINWAATMDPLWLTHDTTWFSAAAGREITKPRWLLVTHLFNHQTHHRGQVHCLLTQAGLKLGDTDLALMPSG